MLAKMNSTIAVSGGPAGTDRGAPPPGRRRRCAAVLIDLASATLAVAAAALIATLWLLVRTAWGRDDPASGDALIATALVLAATPGWGAWQYTRVRRGEGTAGQALLGLTVRVRPDGTRARHAGASVRLAAHPLAITLWLWLAALAVMFERIPLALLWVGAAGVWALAGIASTVVVMRDPSARALHDRLAGTSLVRR